LFAIVSMTWMFIWNDLGYSAYVMPPLLVAIYEAFHEQDLQHRVILKRSIILTAAAVLGTLLFIILPHHMLILGVIAISVTLVLTHVFRVHLIPAFAISLLPIVIHVTHLWGFPLSVLLSSYCMFFMVWFLNRVRNRVLS